MGSKNEKKEADLTYTEAMKKASAELLHAQESEPSSCEDVFRLTDALRLVILRSFAILVERSSLRNVDPLTTAIQGLYGIDKGRIALVAKQRQEKERKK